MAGSACRRRQRGFYTFARRAHARSSGPAQRASERATSSGLAAPPLFVGDSSVFGAPRFGGASVDAMKEFPVGCLPTLLEVIQALWEGVKKLLEAIGIILLAILAVLVFRGLLRGGPGLSPAPVPVARAPGADSGNRVAA